MGLFCFGTVLIASYLTCVVCEPIRTKRLAATSYIIDTFVVVDTEMYARWENLVKNETGVTTVDTLKTQTEGRIKEYVSLIFHQANLRLKSLNNYLPYNISLQIVQMNINVDIPYLKQSATIEDALKVFHNWTIAANLTFDHSILMTSKLFQSRDPAGEIVTYLGRAYVSQMCSVQGYSVSVIMDRGAFQSSYHLTHELGHSLGANHDGILSSASCPKTDLYIMTPVGTTSGSSSHPWHFSNCSAVNIKDYINKVLSRNDTDNEIRNCLSSSLQPMKEFTDTINVKVGQVFPPDKQCQMLYGTSARACPDAANLENICTTMGCVDPQKPNECNVYFAAEWTSCGDQKWCNLGQCISDQSAPNISDCYLGDSVATKGDKPCSEVIQENPIYCYNFDTYKDCCNSCKKASVGNPQSCPYGDKVAGCSLVNCADAESREKCCKTCQCSSSVQTLDGLSCSERVKLKGINECYNSTVAARCCSECDKLRPNAIISNCDYGDKIFDGYCQAASCSTVKETCCFSCSKFNDGLDGGVVVHFTGKPNVISSNLQDYGFYPGLNNIYSQSSSGGYLARVGVA